MTVRVSVLPNAVRVLSIHMPHLDSVSLGAFVATGSRNESAANNGVSHFLEHMAFKGTATRDCRRITQDVERLGAEINAYTSKETTVYHVDGRREHLPVFVELLGDILQKSAFPPAELERERGVILQEWHEIQDDPGALVYELFDAACFGEQPYGQAILGPRRNIERLTRDDLVAYVRSQYTGANLVVAAAGRIEHDDFVAEVARHFGDLPAGTPNPVARPDYRGGIKARRRAGFSQSQVVIGFPIETAREAYHASLVAATLFGGGMSSPLYVDVREQRGLCYSVSSAADIGDLFGHFYVDASTTPEHLDELFRRVAVLLRAHAQGVDPVDLERARNQLIVDVMRAGESAATRVEDAVDDLFVLGAVEPPEHYIARIEAVSAHDVSAAFARMIARKPTVAVIGKGADERLYEVFTRALAQAPAVAVAA